MVETALLKRPIKRSMRFWNTEAIRENQAIRTSLRIDSRESGHLRVGSLSLGPNSRSFLLKIGVVTARQNLKHLDPHIGRSPRVLMRQFFMSSFGSELPLVTKLLHVVFPQNTVKHEVASKMKYCKNDTTLQR